MTYLLAGLVYFVSVTLKAVQQRQVQHAEYRKMPLVSYGMSFCEIFLLSIVVKNAGDYETLFFLAIAIGTGSSAGSIFGTYLHARVLPHRHG